MNLAGIAAVRPDVAAELAVTTPGREVEVRFEVLGQSRKLVLQHLAGPILERVPSASVVLLERLAGFVDVVEIRRGCGHGLFVVVLERVAKVLVNKGVVLGKLDRPEEALAALAAVDEAVARLGGSSKTAELMSVTEALRDLLRKGPQNGS